MNPEQLAKNYDQLAEHWNGENFNRNNGIEQHLRAIRFATKQGRAIDIGCGSSGRIIDLMLENGFEAEGLDISEEMLRLAAERHPNIPLHLANIVTWEFPHQYDFISAWDSVWHVPLEHHQAVLEKLCHALTTNGVLIYSSGGIDAPSEGSNPFQGQELYHAALGIPKLLEIAHACDCICRHLEYDEAHGDDIGKHLYLIIQKTPQ